MSASMRQLLISSAPARKDTKLAIMEYFKNAELWEAYGSTEAGLVTLLRPEEQFKKLGSIGREIWGTDRIKILDENGKEVPEDRWESFIHGPPMSLKSTGRIRKRQNRFSRENGSQQGIWLTRTKMGTLSWWIERRT